MKNRRTQTVVTRQLNALIIYALCVTIALIVVSVRFSKHECPKPTGEAKHKIEILELKLKKYEDIISNDSVIIWKSDRKYRDSIRAIRFDRYMQ